MRSTNTTNPEAVQAASPGSERQVDDLVRANEELTEVNRTLSEEQEQLGRSEKSPSIGQLAAGAGHEINNPVRYIVSNFGTLEKYLVNVFRMPAAFEEGDEVDTEVGRGTRFRVTVPIEQQRGAP